MSDRKMSEKDITEKMLLSYNDVFSDVINGLVFKGEQKIKSGTYAIPKLPKPYDIPYLAIPNIST